MKKATYVVTEWPQGFGNGDGYERGRFDKLNDARAFFKGYRLNLVRELSEEARESRIFKSEETSNLELEKEETDDDDDYYFRSDVIYLIEVAGKR